MREDLDSVIDDLLGCRDVVSAARVLRQLGDRLGFRWVSACADCSSPNVLLDENGASVPGIFGWDQGFVDLWIDKRLTLTDPIGQACRFATRPFAWYCNTAWERWPSLTPAQRRTLEFLRRHGIHCGITVPVHRPRGRLGWVGMVHDRERADLPDLARRFAGPLMLFGSYFLDVVYHQLGEDLDETELTMLSEREIACLTLVARGKTDLEIGEIMGRSPTTARFHVEKAVKKLGATSRTQAAAMASQLGLIGPVV